MNDLGIVIAVVGVIGTPLAMLVHIAGVLAGWWGQDYITWYIPLFGFLLIGAGNAIDTYRGKEYA